MKRKSLSLLVAAVCLGAPFSFAEEAPMHNPIDLNEGLFQSAKNWLAQTANQFFGYGADSRL